MATYNIYKKTENDYELIKSLINDTLLNAIAEVYKFYNDPNFAIIPNDTKDAIIIRFDDPTKSKFYITNDTLN